MIDNGFQVRYNSLPIAIYAVNEKPLSHSTPFMLTHHHSEFEVIAVISGNCQVMIEQTAYIASAGDLLLIPPYSLHSGCVLSGSAFSHICFCFDISVLGDVALAKQLKNNYLDVTRLLNKENPITKILFPIALEIYNQCNNHAKGWVYVVRGQLLTFLGLLEQSENTFAVCGETANYDFGVRALEIVNEYYLSKLTSRDMAVHMAYSQSYFCRIFRESFSTSFQCFLCQFRLCKAKLLLTQRGACVNEVALQSGFNNISYFSKQFRLMYGCTPKQFQQLNAHSHSFDEFYSAPSTVAGYAKP